MLEITVNPKCSQKLRAVTNVTALFLALILGADLLTAALSARIAKVISVEDLPVFYDSV